MSKDSMTDAMDNPEDPGNHFPEFHHAAPPFDRPPSPPAWAALEERIFSLERRLANAELIAPGYMDATVKRIAALEAALDDEWGPRIDNRTMERIAELETRVEADGVAINQLFTRAIILEEALAKQRAVNEALLVHMAALDIGRPNLVAIALRDALPPPHLGHKPPSP